MTDQQRADEERLAQYDSDKCCIDFGEMTVGCWAPFLRRLIRERDAEIAAMKHDIGRLLNSVSGEAAEVDRLGAEIDRLRAETPS